MSLTPEPLVRAEGLRMAFGGVEVVKGVDIALRAGEVHAILGENGAGKSTVAKIVAGVHRPVGGSLFVRGERVSIENPRHALQLGIALIHQEPLTFPDLTVAENVFVGHQPVGVSRRVDWREMHSRAGSLLESLGARFSTKSLAGGLSVADQQMIELASALSHEAKVLLMDETTASLTPKEVAELFAIVRRLKGEGCAIAFVSHRLDEIFEIADRITVMRDGAKVGEVLPRESSISQVVKMMVGREVLFERPLSTTSPGAVALSVSDLRVGGLRVREPGADRASALRFEVRAGEIVGLAGLVGAGRTEVCEALFGVRPFSGRVEVCGKEARIRNPREAISHGLAMVPEDRQHDGLLLPMSLSQNATLTTLKGWWLREKRERSSTAEYLKKLQTAFRSVGQPARELSGGNQQKVVLAKWLMTQPRVLILDEPTRGVDVGAKEEVHRLMRELVAEGLAILMVSSDLPEVLALSDRVLVMREGRLVAEFPASEATPESVMMAATGQGAHAV